jgi:membrane protein DedA with SNARE-associated domain
MISVPLFISYLSTYGYAALYLIVFMGGTYLPVPAGLFVIAAGAFSHAGYFNIYASLLATVFGGVSASMLHFLIARKFEKKEYFHRYVEKHKYAKRIQTYMQKYPQRTIFLSRFVGFASMPVNIFAGLSKIPTRTFLLVDILANIVTASVYLAIGYVVGIAATQGTHIITLVGVTVGIVSALYLIIFFFSQRLSD